MPCDDSARCAEMALQMIQYAQTPLLMVYRLPLAGTVCLHCTLRALPLCAASGFARYGAVQGSSCALCARYTSVTHSARRVSRG